MHDRVEDFPCLCCGKRLYRAFRDYEAQPSEGVICTAKGNYGSTVFDPFDGETLFFNICDTCLVTKGKQGRVFSGRTHRLIRGHGIGVIGRQRVERPFVPWHEGLPSDDDELVIGEDDLIYLYDKEGYEWLHPLNNILRMFGDEDITGEIPVVEDE